MDAKVLAPVATLFDTSATQTVTDTLFRLQSACKNVIIRLYRHTFSDLNVLDIRHLLIMAYARYLSTLGPPAIDNFSHRTIKKSCGSSITPRRSVMFFNVNIHSMKGRTSTFPFVTAAYRNWLTNNRSLYRTHLDDDAWLGDDESLPMMRINGSHEQRH